MSWRSTLQTVALLAMGLHAVSRSAVRRSVERCQRSARETLRNERAVRRSHYRSQAGDFRARGAVWSKRPTAGDALLNNLGELHYKLGHLLEAMPFYQRSWLSPSGPSVSTIRQPPLRFRNLALYIQLNRVASRRPRRSTGNRSQALRRLRTPGPSGLDAQQPRHPLSRHEQGDRGRAGFAARSQHLSRRPSARPSLHQHRS